MFPYNEEENAWISQTHQVPKKCIIKLVSKAETINNNSSIYLTVFYD